jgi:meso-butanediol dehydrogenase / (S,S)-butanediol dehydrogenase / diacetyl reductase
VAVAGAAGHHAPSVPTIPRIPHDRIHFGDNARASRRPGRLAGRRALITGASRGIGQAIALRYADEGADLCLVATTWTGLPTPRRRPRPAAREVHGAGGDVADRHRRAGHGRPHGGHLGGIDVLVNNAGVYHAATLLDTEPEDFDRVMQVNVYGAFHVLQLCLRQMQHQGAGKVVNIASTAGKGGSMNQSAYNASKHALVGLTRCAAVELGPRHLRQRHLPGFVRPTCCRVQAHARITGLPFERSWPTAASGCRCAASCEPRRSRTWRSTSARPRATA